MARVKRRRVSSQVILKGERGGRAEIGELKKKTRKSVQETEYDEGGVFSGGSLGGGLGSGTLEQVRSGGPQ